LYAKPLLDNQVDTCMPDLLICRLGWADRALVALDRLIVEPASAAHRCDPVHCFIHAYAQNNGPAKNWPGEAGDHTPMPRIATHKAAKLALAGIAAMSFALSVFAIGFLQGRDPDSLTQRGVGTVVRSYLELRGAPSEIERRMAFLSTTFIDFEGKVYEIPNNDGISGGAIGVWGDELIIMNHTGLLYLHKKDTGLIPIEIKTPSNGINDYINILQTGAFRASNHAPEKIRYNDILLAPVGHRLKVIVSYTHFDKENLCFRNRVSQTVTETPRSLADLRISPDQWSTLHDTSPCIPLVLNGFAIDGAQAGGRMALKGTNLLYLSVGDFYLDGYQAKDIGLQSDVSSYGKVIEINTDTGASRIFSKGHRNIQGLAFDKGGSLWAVEHGMRGGDELNLIEDGANYGWPVVSLGTLYGGRPIPNGRPAGRHEGYVQPVFAWLPSAGVSSLTAIAGLDESWDGDLLAGSLATAETGQSLFHIRSHEGRVVFVERIKIGSRVRSLRQFGKDKIALWLDSNHLVVLKVKPRPDTLSATSRRVLARYGETFGRKVVAALQGCAQCHSFEKLDNASTPSLYGVVGRRMAATSFSSYSGALRGRSDTWTPENLARYISDPAGFAPGTSMPSPGIRDPKLIEGLVFGLEQTNKIPLRPERRE